MKSNELLQSPTIFKRKHKKNYRQLQGLNIIWDKLPGDLFRLKQVVNNPIEININWDKVSLSSNPLLKDNNLWLVNRKVKTFYCMVELEAYSRSASTLQTLLYIGDPLILEQLWT